MVAEESRESLAFSVLLTRCSRGTRSPRWLSCRVQPEDSFCSFLIASRNMLLFFVNPSRRHVHPSEDTSVWGGGRCAWRSSTLTSIDAPGCNRDGTRPRVERRANNAMGLLECTANPKLRARAVPLLLFEVVGGCWNVHQPGQNKDNVSAKFGKDAKAAATVPVSVHVMFLLRSRLSRY